ncbi:platelet endothelial aggregation receptor 1 [Biomphalaria pfeifferi]|uniref:Platelet endothelial aggregation receptor 1 n=1 Tax=Biomphalaria pfeifferi TaxID=112525 RepID=A0AAD8BW43_BIOPF|nr:platelet endothelial aggregation receptor 1 [Biomphalaria pfeifferi]
MTRSSLMLALVIMASVLITSGQQSTEEAGKGFKPGTHMGKMFYVILPHVLQTFDPVLLKPSLDFIFFGNGDRIKIVQTLSKNTFNTTKPTYVKPQERVIVIDHSGYARVSITCTFNNTCGEMLKDQRVWSFRFVSEHLFGMYVHYLVSDLSAATLTPVPVESWGKKYFVVTLGSQHFIGILAGEVGVNVTLMFNFERDYEGIVHDGYTYRLNNELKVFVQKSEGYIISTCGKSDYIGHISGTSIEGKEPFGVVSGSCSSGTMATPCSGTGKESVGRNDMAAEMLLPSESFGRDFIVFQLEVRRSLGYYLITASKPDTVVRVMPVRHSYFLAPFTLQQRETRQFTLNYAYISSDKGIQVSVIQSSACLAVRSNIQEMGDPSICIMVPMGLFYSSYVWMYEPALSNNSYAAIIVRWDYKDYIELDKTALSTAYTWENLTAKNNLIWTVAHLKVLNVRARIHTLTSSKSAFGCYFYGFTMDAGFMNPGGFIVSPINEMCQIDVTRTQLSDLIDNDCDGFVDEEILDGKDNDGDGLIDEDTNSFKITKDYGPWSEWVCGRDCFEGKMYRIRECKMDSPNVICKGESTQTRDAECYTVHMCPALCKDREWGLGCKFKCMNCETDCDKFTGACERCLPGYLDTNNSCNRPCNVYTYGQDCSQDCKFKCEGDDCLERVFGTCPNQGATLRSTINPAFRSDKGFGQWSEWACSKTCTEPKQARKRNCISEEPELQCYGKREEWKSFNCYVNELCPGVCPKGEWGVDCVNKCGHCLDDCDKFQGSCSACQPGFMGRETGCMKACGEGSYGQDCSGNCQQKCGSDCVDRVTGECAMYGVFGDWQEWGCSNDCNDSQLVRERFCYSPYPDMPYAVCRGDSLDRRPGNCYVDKKCPIKCPLKKWGPGCTKRCDKCVGDCDKFNGTCKKCKPGFRFPQKGCIYPCERDRYGEDCKLSCEEKCGSNCIETVTGKCKSKSNAKYAIFIILIPSPLAVYYLLPRKTD